MNAMPRVRVERASDVHEPQGARGKDRVGDYSTLRILWEVSSRHIAE